MKGKQILFFCTFDDIKSIVQEIELKFSFKYIQMGLFDESKIITYESIFDVPEIGFAKYGDWNRDLRLMAVPKTAVVHIREVLQRKGGMKYVIDPLENQQSICFQFGGVFKEGVLVAGKCGSVFLDNFSIEIFKVFSSLLKKKTVKIGDFYVGTEAEKKLRLGWRLVTDMNSPIEYDLSLH